MSDTRVFAVDVGGTTVKLGLFDREGTLLEKWEIPTRIQDGGSQILPDVVAAIRACMARTGITPDQVVGVGFGVPGPVDGKGVVQKCINLGWGVFNLKQAVNELMPEFPNVLAGNDANVAALGESWMGSGNGCENSVMFTLGTGVGGGVVLNGQIIAGANGAAGELGHLTVEPDETTPCNCGKKGCLEQYASANGIVRLAKRIMADRDTPSPLRSMDTFTSKDICDLAREGDELAGVILDRCARYLGQGLSFAACAFDPQVFIIGGGMSRAGAILLDAVERYYRSFAFHPSVDTPIVAAKLGNDAGIYGCAAMVLHSKAI